MSASRPFLFLSANTPWVYALAQALSADAPVTAVQMYDVATQRRLRPGWPEEESNVRRRRVVMPSGYAGRLEFLFRPLMRRIVEAERKRLARIGNADPIVVIPYHYLVPWVRQVPDELLVYYNLDNYDLYRPSRVGEIHSLEDEVIRRARLTACLSIYQVERLAARNPQRRESIRHFPLGVVDAFINPDPRAEPLAKTVGYVGNLTNRVDWGLVTAVAQRMPEVRFEFVGSMQALQTGLSSATWEQERQAALALPNVVHVGQVRQLEVPRYYWRYSVNWMPYDAAHPFNLAACPTKIMDAIASGRPFVSTPTPEVGLYPDFIATAADADGLAAALRHALSTPIDPAVRISFARNHVWAERARQLREMLWLLDAP